MIYVTDTRVRPVTIRPLSTLDVILITVLHMKLHFSILSCDPIPPVLGYNPLRLMTRGRKPREIENCIAAKSNFKLVEVHTIKNKNVLFERDYFLSIFFHYAIVIVHIKCMNII